MNTKTQVNQGAAAVGSGALLDRLIHKLREEPPDTTGYEPGYGGNPNARTYWQSSKLEAAEAIRSFRAGFWDLGRAWRFLRAHLQTHPNRARIGLTRHAFHIVAAFRRRSIDADCSYNVRSNALGQARRANDSGINGRRNPASPAPSCWTRVSCFYSWAEHEAHDATCSPRDRKKRRHSNGDGEIALQCKQNHGP